MGNGVGVLKILAIVSSVALGGAYVAYRQGYFRKESPQPAASSGAAAEGPSRPTVLPGSKSIDAVLSQPRDHVVPPAEPAADAAGASAGAGDPRAVLPGSKSGLVFPEADQAVKPKPIPKRTVLPSSKSAQIELKPEPEPEPEPEPQPQAPSQPQPARPQQSK